MAKGKNTGSSIKRLIGNKNTVTFLGVVASIAILVIGYNMRVKGQISPMSVPYAKTDIKSRTLITSDMVGRIKISSSYVSQASNLKTSVSEVVNSYASYKTSIPKGSLFYDESVVNADEMPDAAFANIPDGDTVFALPVNDEKTFNNSIRAGSYIDLYMSVTNPENDDKVIFAKLVESIRVLAVKDNNGNNILKNSSLYGSPTQLLFSVDEDMFLLLKRAMLIRSVNVDIEPVIRNQNYTTNPNQTQVSSEQLREFINARVLILD